MRWLCPCKRMVEWFLPAIPTMAARVICAGPLYGRGAGTSGIPDVVVDEEAGNTVIDLLPAFFDPNDADSALTFAIAGNTLPSLFCRRNDQCARKGR